MGLLAYLAEYLDSFLRAAVGAEGANLLADYIGKILGVRCKVYKSAIGDESASHSRRSEPVDLRVDCHFAFRFRDVCYDDLGEEEKGAMRREVEGGFAIRDDVAEMVIEDVDYLVVGYVFLTALAEHVGVWKIVSELVRDPGQHDFMWQKYVLTISSFHKSSSRRRELWRYVPLVEDGLDPVGPMSSA